MKFLDLAFELGLVVSSAFEMGTAEDTPIGTAQERAIALAHLQRRLQISKHRALVMWQVGSGPNGSTTTSYEHTYLWRYMPCF